MFSRKKITGLYKEFSVPLWLGISLLIIASSVIFMPWLMSNRELFRNESLHAVIAGEFSFSSPVPTAHHIQQLSEGVLFQALSAMLHHATGLPIDKALRTVSFIMLLLTAALTGASASARSARAGLVSAAVMLTTILALDKAIEGYPTTTNAFFLLSAQLAFFHYGIRKANWNMAWIISALLVTLAFFSGGFRMLIYFIFPMLFFRRPLSVKSKFRKPGFVVAILILSLISAGYLLQFSISTGKSITGVLLDSEFQSSDYWMELLAFPVMLPVRLLPWTFIAWMPFCVALQSTDQTPIYSRYLRTLTLSTLLLLWIMPDHDARELIYLIGPLAIQTGIFYDLGTRRYGNRIRKLLIVGELLIAIELIAFICVIFLPENIIGSLISISSSLDFRNSEKYMMELLSAMMCTLALGVFFYCGRRSAPLWMLILTLSVTTGLFYGSVINPYRSQDDRKHKLANDIKNALREESVDRLYKCDIRGFYGGLFYTGIPVYQLKNVSELPENKDTVYLISTTFPQTLDRKWSNLLAPNYTYQKEKIYLWKGVLKENSEFYPEH